MTYECYTCYNIQSTLKRAVAMLTGAVLSKLAHPYRFGLCRYSSQKDTAFSNKNIAFSNFESTLPQLRRQLGAQGFYLSIYLSIYLSVYLTEHLSDLEGKQKVDARTANLKWIGFVEPRNASWRGRMDQITVHGKQSQKVQP